MTYEEFKKDFTDEQILWLAQHAETPRGTKEQQLASYADQLYNAKMWSTPKDLEHLLNLSAKPKNVYSVKDILSTVAPGQKADSVAVNQFIEDWNSGNVDNQAVGRLSVKYGPGAYRNADKVMKQAYADKQAAVKPMSTAESVLGTLLLPRTTEARKAGKPVGGKDIGLDLLENALMLAPFGMLTAVPKIARAGRAAKALTGIGTAAVVPHVMEGVDASAYSPSENLDRSVYNETDALLGWATNVGAPLVLDRTLGRLGKFAADKAAGAEGKGLSDVTKETLTSLRKAGEWVKPDKESVKAVKNFNYENTVKSKSGAKVGDETAEAYVSANKRADEGLALQEEGAKALDEVIDLVETNLDNTDASKLEELLEKYHSASKLGKQQTEKAISDLNKVSKVQQAQIEAEKKFAKTNGAQDYIEAGLLKKRSEETGMAIPELLKSGKAKDILDFSKQLADADWMAKLQMSHPGAAKALDIGRNMAESWVVNKYGSKRDATPVLGGISNLIQSVAPGTDLQKVFQNARKENVEPVERQYRKDIAKSVLDNLPKDASDDDKKFMKMVVDNPDVLKGMGKGNTPAFRNWYLLRGSDILRGTELYRPTFEVE